MPHQKLQQGLQALGVHCGEIPRNCSPEHTCGHCCLGCPSGDKQDGTGTYLSDAARHGALIFTGTIPCRGIHCHSNLLCVMLFLLWQVFAWVIAGA